MSIIVASGEAISRSPLNKSQSKQMFSFPKAARFEKIRSSGYASVFYDLPEVRMKRYTSLGKGTKFDFTKEKKGMNPQIYDFKSDFDREHPHSPMFTFGIEREKYAKVYYETNKTLDKDIPGPGKYNYLKPFGSDASKFSMKGNIDMRSSSSISNLPGPGAYPITIQISPKGRYPISAIQNIKEVSFATKEKRFQYDYNNFPGPHQYELKSMINGTGVIFNSKFHSSPGKSITGKSIDLNSARKNYPGPGSYRAFSEFGIYESKTAHQEKGETSSRGNSQEKEKEKEKGKENK